MPHTRLERAKNELGVRFSTLETSEGSDREAQLRQLAEGDAKIVFAVGFLFTDDVRALAKEFPDRKFGCIDYTVDPKDTIPPNLVALKFREEEGSFLVGALAGLLTKTGKVGFVGRHGDSAHPQVPGGLRRRGEGGEPGSAGDGEVRRHHGRRVQGSHKGKELALAEYHGGADIIFHASGSTGLACSRRRAS